MKWEELTYKQKQQMYDKAVAWKNNIREEKQFSLLKMVAKHFDVSIDEIKGKKRDRKFADTRHCVSYLFREHTNLTMAEIGSLIGNDHCSVIHGVKKVKALREINQAPYKFNILEHKFKQLWESEKE